MNVHAYTVVVRFGDCDPAGILYYPRFFDLFHQAMEHWFDHGLHEPYHRFIQVQRRGLPSVQAHADFASPAHQGDELTVGLSVARIGRSSVELHYSMQVGDRVVATGYTVNVHMDLDPSSPTFRRALPWSDDLRIRMLPYVQRTASSSE